MIRIQFKTTEDRIKGNYVLITNTVSRRLRGDIFEIADADRKLLDDHQLQYVVLPAPEAPPANEEVRGPFPVAIQPATSKSFPSHRGE